MKQGTLIFDERTDRYGIRFDLADYYGGLHCGQCQNGAPAKSQILWGEEEQGSGRSFRCKAETELNRLCNDEVPPWEELRKEVPPNIFVKSAVCD